MVLRVIAVEDLSVKTPRSWIAFVDILEAKAESAGHRGIRAPAPFTSQRCSRCCAMAPKSLSLQAHICASCGYVADLDHNAAQDILDRARTRDGWGAAFGERKGIAARVEPRRRL